MSSFRWTRRREKAAQSLAQGYTQRETAAEIGVTERTIRRWLSDLDFQMEVDRLSLLVGIASKAERLRIAMRVAREKIREKVVITDKDLLDWLKFAQSETDGARLDLSSLFASLEGAAEDDGTSDESEEPTV